MGLFSFLFKSETEKAPKVQPILVDMHGHFLPNIDDGSSGVEESLAMLRFFEDRGYKKIIATPHIIQDLYGNTPETIKEAHDRVLAALPESGLSIKLEAAAEYFIDEQFIEWVEQGVPLLTLKDNLVLVETGFINEPVYLREVLFKMRLKGYKPVLAHPERYLYLQTKPHKLEELFDSGVLLQVNLMSLAGYYGPPAQKFVEWMLEMGFIHFLGSDCHRTKHFEPLQKALSSKLYHKIMELPLLNDTLL